MQNSRIFFFIKALSLIGIILAIYLLWQQFFRPEFQPCYINNIINCDAIISGAVAKTLGLPTPFYGLIGYIVILFSAVFQKRRLLLGVSTFGLLFCLWIAYRELFELRVICPICILCQIIMITVFTFSFMLNKKNFKSEASS
jgi:uncharacterized membrane protein